MNGNALSSRGPAIALLETSSIAKGIEATDAMMKRAAVELLMTILVPRGKYLVAIAGAVADVEASLHAGKEIAGAAVLDEFLIQNADPQLPAAIKGKVKVTSIVAVGIIETKEVASAIFAADAAVKAADVTLIEARNQPGAKGMVVLTGEVGAVRAAIAAGVATIKRDGMLIAEVVIPYAHEALVKSSRPEATPGNETGHAPMRAPHSSSGGKLLRGGRRAGLGGRGRLGRGRLLRRGGLGAGLGARARLGRGAGRGRVLVRVLLRGRLGRRVRIDGHGQSGNDQPDRQSRKNRNAPDQEAARPEDGAVAGEGARQSRRRPARTAVPSDDARAPAPPAQAAIERVPDGRRLKLVGSAHRSAAGIDARVSLEELPGHDPLAILDDQANALEIDSTPLGRIVITQRDGALAKTRYALLTDPVALRRRLCS